MSMESATTVSHPGAIPLLTTAAAISGGQCPRCVSTLVTILLVILIADTARGAPRPSSDLSPLRGNGIRGGTSGRWGLKLDTLPLKGNVDLNTVVDLLSNNSSPSMRLFLADKLFLHHLKLYINQPTSRHKQQLHNRLLTLRNRRTDEMSSRFFLRD